MKPTIFNAIFTALVGGLLFAPASPGGPAKQKVVPGQESRQRVEKVNAEMHWYRNLEDAKSEAARQRKMVFWVHMLGKLDGKT